MEEEGGGAAAVEEDGGVTTAEEGGVTTVDKDGATAVEDESGAAKGELVLESLESDLVPAPVEYAVLLPPDYAADGEPLPLMLLLHGGGGSRDFLVERMRPQIEALWNDGTLPPIVVATPSVGRSLYMDYRDGSQRWESFVLGPFVERLRARFNVRDDAGGTLLVGVSMGGMGGLRMALKYPDRFGAVAALEPGIDPALEWSEVQPRHRFYRADRLMESIFGSPLDEGYWRDNNPASIAVANAGAIRDSGILIYIEVGDEDFLNLDEGTEFLHRVLWDLGIPHEYHLVRGANHVGRSLPRRFTEAFEFVARALSPDTSPDSEVTAMERALGGAKERGEAASPEPWRGEFSR